MEQTGRAGISSRAEGTRAIAPRRRSWRGRERTRGRHGQGNRVSATGIQLTSEAIVILGSGMSGGVAAKTLREGGYDGRLVLIGHEPTPPFGRPPLSKTYLRGEESLSGWLVNPDRWYESNRVELVAATATGVNVPMRQVELDAGRSIAFGKLLITTGGENRHLDLAGAELPGVFQLRTVGES